MCSFGLRCRCDNDKLMVSRLVDGLRTGSFKSTLGESERSRISISKAPQASYKAQEPSLHARDNDAGSLMDPESKQSAIFPNLAGRGPGRTPCLGRATLIWVAKQGYSLPASFLSERPCYAESSSFELSELDTCSTLPLRVASWMDTA